MKVKIQTPVVRVLYEGELMFTGTEDEARQYISRAQPQSVEWAVEFDGWSVERANVEYRCDDETFWEKECQKMDHYVTIDGTEHRMDFSPYAKPSDATVAAWVILDRPGRIDGSTLRDEDIYDLASRREVTFPKWETDA